MLRVESVTKSFGGQQVLLGASLALKPGERAALVGPNGAGKSTLLKIIAGLDAPDAGRVRLPSPGSVVAYLPQDASVTPGRSLHDEVLTAVADVLALEEQMRAVEREIDAPGVADGDLERLVQQHAALQEQFERRDGYAIEAEVGRVLDGLGFTQADRVRLTQEFSGGWQMRIALARLLLARPDVLLMDEPTNHLDVAATEWLEEYLKTGTARSTSLLLVSHDRYFLDAVVERVFDLRGGKVEAFSGNYSVYRVERARRDEALQALAERQREDVERLEAYIRRYRAGNRATMARSREKMLERLEAERVAAPRRERMVHFRFPDCPPSGREVLALRGASRAYGARVVLDGVSLTIERGERVALIGPNGSGKTTLLKLMAQRDQPTRGSVAHGVGVRLSSFAQDQAEQLDPENTVFEEVYQAAPAAWDTQAVRDLLGRFLFSGELQLKSVGGLSGGERSRVALAKLLLRPSNLLLLDEPTNHLDIATRDRLESTLAEYPGTLVFVTHDRYLVDRLATQVVEVGGGTLRVYPGSYADYRRARAAEQKAAQAEPRPDAPVGRTPAPVRAAPGPGRASRRLAADLRDLERQVTDAEERLRAVERLLSQPAGQDVAALSREHETLAAEVAALTARWETLALAAEGAA